MLIQTFSANNLMNKDEVDYTCSPSYEFKSFDDDNLSLEEKFSLLTEEERTYAYRIISSLLSAKESKTKLVVYIAVKYVDGERVEIAVTPYSAKYETLNQTSPLQTYTFKWNDYARIIKKHGGFFSFFNNFLCLKLIPFDPDGSKNLGILNEMEIDFIDDNRQSLVYQYEEEYHKLYTLWIVSPNINTYECIVMYQFLIDFLSQHIEKLKREAK